MQKLFEFVEHIGKWRVLVQTRDIQNGAVTTAKIADNAVTTEKIGEGEVKSRNIADNAVITEKIGDGEVKTRNIADGAVTTEKIPDGAVTTPKIGDGEVKSADIADGAVTTAKIGNGEVKTRNIGDSAVTTEKLEDYNPASEAPTGVTTDKLADGAVTTEKILDKAVITVKIAEEAVTTPKIAPHAVTRDKIADEAVPELLGLMDEFVEAVRAEISQQQPVTIRGNVENAADEEDLTVVDGLLKLKDRSGLYGYAMKILRRGEPFSEAVTQMRCIYVVQYDFDLGGETVTMPAESMLLFTGGKLRNGGLVGTKDTGGDPHGEGAFGLMLCSALYYDYLDNVELGGVYQDETAKSLQDQINAIVSGGADVSLAASPSAIFVGVATDVTLTATTSAHASAIAIKRGGDTLASGAGYHLTHTDAVTLDAPGTVGYQAEFTISGLQRADSKSVTAVYPIAYGALTAYGAAQLTQLSTPTTAVARSYTVNLDSTRRNFYLRVPKQGVAQVKSVVMGSGSEASPVSGGIVAELGDENYNVWASDDGFTGNGPQVFTVS